MKFQNWLRGLIIAVLSATGLSGVAKSAKAVDVNIYSFVSPHFAGGSAYGEIAPEYLQSSFNLFQPVFPDGKGAVGGGGSGSDNPDIYFTFGYQGNFTPLADDPTPEMYPDWANQSVTSYLNVREQSVIFKQDGDEFEVIFTEEFQLSGVGSMGLNFFNPEGESGLVAAGWLNADFSVSGASGARILQMNPQVSDYTFVGDGDDLQYINVSFNGLGMIPGDAYTITQVVPEPVTVAMLGIGGLALGAKTLRRRRGRNENETRSPS